jgi:Flp pilus assembly protein TadG
MRTALGVAAVLFAIGAFVILSAAGRKVCEAQASEDSSTEPEPLAVL